MGDNEKGNRDEIADRVAYANWQIEREQWEKNGRRGPPPVKPIKRYNPGWRFHDGV